jgi:hypothetical protein
LSFAVMGILAMTEIDWTVVGSALLLVSWFGFLLLLLYFSPAIMPQLLGGPAKRCLRPTRDIVKNGAARARPGGQRPRNTERDP